MLSTIVLVNKRFIYNISVNVFVEPFFYIVGIVVFALDFTASRAGSWPRSLVCYCVLGWEGGRQRKFEKPRLGG